jgi:protein-disulfide isomerase
MREPRQQDYYKNDELTGLASMMALWTLLLLLELGFSMAAQAADTTVAEVNGVAITAGEIDSRIGAPLIKLQEQVYNLRRQKIDAVINEKLLADEAVKRGISVQTLLNGEVTSKVGRVTDQEIENFYRDNQTQIKEEQSEVREKIRAYLQNLKLAAKRDEFFRSLRDQARIVNNLQPPPIQRIDVSVQGAPFKGGERAAVTIVEFSDFHCPFCRRVISTLAQLESEYGEKIKLVFHDFPIERLHPGATKAHEAARCADEQGKFWPYHDKLFTGAPASSPEIFKGIANELGLDTSAFATCLSSGKYQAAIKQDIEEGTRVGVSGTPAFLINGRQISGAQSLDVFKRAIDGELARTAAGSGQ